MIEDSCRIEEKETQHITHKKSNSSTTSNFQLKGIASGTIVTKCSAGVEESGADHSCGEIKIIIILL
jgi:hypothetical protein